MKKILFVIMLMSKVYANVDQKIEDAIKDSNLHVIESWVADTNISLSSEEKNKLLGLAQTSVKNAQDDLEAAFSLPQVSRGALGGISAITGLSGIIATYVSYKAEAFYVKDKYDAIVPSAVIAGGCLLLYFGVNEIRKAVINFDRKLVYNNARLILQLIQQIPVK